MNWQGHEVWIQVLLLVLMGQQGAGEGRPGGHSSHQLPHLLLGLVGDLHPVPERGTVEMVLIQCLDPSSSWSGLCCKSIQMRTWHLELQQLFYNHEAMNSTVKSQCSRNSEAEDALGLQELPTSRPVS